MKYMKSGNTYSLICEIDTIWGLAAKGTGQREVFPRFFHPKNYPVSNKATT